ncbi:MAG: LLM class flavin-dependent oxidoreductase [Dehalococcoidia bacterium]
MKVCAFIQTPYRDLPAGFEEKYSPVVTPSWGDLGQAEKVHQYYKWTSEEFLAAAQAGFDAITNTEHGQNFYDMMPNPNLMMASLATLTEGLDVALMVLGTTVGKSHQPLRLAEEYAMLDCMSGGRLITGLPLGLSYDANLNYGVSPTTMRERYREAHDLIIKAWTEPEVFPWNGKYWQFPMVNLWPRPVQQPHPPIWVPGTGNPGTMQWVLDNEYCYTFLSWFGASETAKPVTDRYWETVAAKGKDANPYRLALLQVVAVSESDSRAEEEYAAHIEYFFQKCIGRIPVEWMAVPGYIDYYGLEHIMRDPSDFGLFMQLREMSYKDLVEAGCVIAGSPATVRDRLNEMITDLRIGNLLTMLQVGSMPHELTLKNIDLFAREVLPHIHNNWESDGWSHNWWPKQLVAQHT